MLEQLFTYKMPSHSFIISSTNNGYFAVTEKETSSFSDWIFPLYYFESGNSRTQANIKLTKALGYKLRYYNFRWYHRAYRLIISTVLSWFYPTITIYKGVKGQHLIEE